jgi:hypothetical protein
MPHPKAITSQSICAHISTLIEINKIPITGLLIRLTLPAVHFLNSSLLHFTVIVRHRHLQLQLQLLQLVQSNFCWTPH